MAILRDTHINNNLNVSSGIMTDLKIINNDILYPILSVSYSSPNAIIQVNCRKFNNNLTTSGRPKIHWWISQTKYGYPTAITGTYSITFTLNNGVNLDPTNIPNSAILHTSLTDSNHIYKISINWSSNNLSLTTYYFICSIQGIAYSIPFSVYVNAKQS